MFEVKKYESFNKTIRMSGDLIEKLEQLAQENNISFNKIVVQCCEYALNSMNKEE